MCLLALLPRSSCTTVWNTSRGCHWVPGHIFTQQQTGVGPSSMGSRLSQTTWEDTWANGQLQHRGRRGVWVPGAGRVLSEQHLNQWVPNEVKGAHFQRQSRSQPNGERSEGLYQIAATVCAREGRPRREWQGKRGTELRGELTPSSPAATPVPDGCWPGGHFILSPQSCQDKGEQKEFLRWSFAKKNPVRCQQLPCVLQAFHLHPQKVKYCAS